MNEKTSALFRAQYAYETLFEVYFIRSVLVMPMTDKVTYVDSAM